MAEVKKVGSGTGPKGSTTSSTPEANPVAAGTPATPVVVPSITTEPDTFQEDEGLEDDGTPETLLSPLMDELRQVAEGGSMVTFRKLIETHMPEEVNSARSYLRALHRLGMAATSAASVGQEAFVAKFGN